MMKKFVECKQMLRRLVECEASVADLDYVLDRNRTDIESDVALAYRSSTGRKPRKVMAFIIICAEREEYNLAVRADGAWYGVEWHDESWYAPHGSNLTQGFGVYEIDEKFQPRPIRSSHYATITKECPALIR